MRTELLNGQMLSLSNDTLAVLDVGQATNGSTVRFFDTAQVQRGAGGHAAMRAFGLLLLCA